MDEIKGTKKQLAEQYAERIYEDMVRQITGLVAKGQ